MSLFRKNTVILYLLTNAYETNSNGVPKDMIIYTVSNNLKDCQEYLDLMLKIKYKTHFSSWCEYRNLNFEDEDSWTLYKETSLGEEEYKKYLITKNYYDTKKIATIFRMFNRCPPIGCSFENDIEYEYFITNLDINTRKTLEKEIGQFKKEEQCKSTSI